jgi:hypothetical protein
MPSFRILGEGKSLKTLVIQNAVNHRQKALELK